MRDFPRIFLRPLSLRPFDQGPLFLQYFEKSYPPKQKFRLHSLILRLLRNSDCSWKEGSDSNGYHWLNGILSESWYLGRPGDTEDASGYHEWWYLTEEKHEFSSRLSELCSEARSQGYQLHAWIRRSSENVRHQIDNEMECSYEIRIEDGCDPQLVRVRLKRDAFSKNPDSADGAAATNGKIGTDVSGRQINVTSSNRSAKRFAGAKFARRIASMVRNFNIFRRRSQWAKKATSTPSFQSGSVNQRSKFSFFGFYQNSRSSRGGPKQQNTTEADQNEGSISVDSEEVSPDEVVLGPPF